MFSICEIIFFQINQYAVFNNDIKGANKNKFLKNHRENLTFYKRQL